jgi:hypothetical protein
MSVCGSEFPQPFLRRKNGVGLSSIFSIEWFAQVRDGGRQPTSVNACSKDRRIIPELRKRSIPSSPCLRASVVNLPFSPFRLPPVSPILILILGLIRK